MSTMYIAYSGTVERGYFLGDVILCIKTAQLFVRNEPHDAYVMSMMRDDKFNFLWDRFIRENHVRVVFDDWGRGDKHAQYRNFDLRRAERKAHEIPFQSYRELYPRLDGGDRQGVLCGHEAGLGRRNVVEYFYYGQEGARPEPRGSCEMGDDVIDVPPAQRVPRSVLIAPHEKCQGNRCFTLRMWCEVVDRLLAAGVQVCLNDDGAFMQHRRGVAGLSWAFPRGTEMLRHAASFSAVACGNTGLGWVAAVTGTPLVACEKDMCFTEYSFKANGVKSLRATVTNPSADEVAAAILAAV